MRAAWARRKAKAAEPHRTADESSFIHAAHRFVQLAIRFGYLAPIDGQACVDCHAPAWCYEHRNYGQPLDVEPVCRSCNGKRGMGQMPPRIADST